MIDQTRIPANSIFRLSSWLTGLIPSSIMREQDLIFKASVY